MADIAKTTPESTPPTIYLKDYTPPAYLVDTVELEFDLDEQDTVVRAKLAMRRNPDHPHANPPLVLDGQQLELLALRLDGRELREGDYTLDDEHLTIERVPAAFTLESEVRIHPAANTALEGLYHSGHMLCTQCEAEGFRRITFYPDRPDVMARFTVTLRGDRARYPVLLSNGNPVAQGEAGDRHWVRWEDPFPKPSYLFAVVAGQLECVEDRFTTRSGREVALRLYVEKENLGKTDHALASLKQAMRWDEETYGREYDLDIYMIVAVNDFNMGAMENKGLNIFNASCVLASPETATDGDYYNIQSIIGHEYFHNWSGNRVTCRDWFQLSLKEGFTVFRDQEFSADLNSRGVKRIDDVNVLRTHQFAEDASPMAHPVRPDHYIEINNFYTVTVYNKGAEVVRMIKELTGRDGFRKGTDLYFERHDGQAVTTDDFVRAMEDANGIDLTRFRRWYDQAGTPEITVREDWDEAQGIYSLTLSQTCPPTPGQPEKKPFHIPVAVGLMDAQGNDLPLQCEGEQAPAGSERVLSLTEPEQTFRFVGLSERPRPSLLRRFSAPVKLHTGYTDADWRFRLAHESDDFNRWEAGQELAMGALLRLVTDVQQAHELAVDTELLDAFGKVLNDADIDKALAARILTLPSESYIADQMAVVDVEAIHAARQFLRKRLAEHLREDFLRLYEANVETGPYRFSADDMARRSFRNMALGYLVALEEPAFYELCVDQYEARHNMTDMMAALSLLADLDIPARQAALDDFYARYRHDPQVVEKWLALQAGSALPDTLERVRALMDHPAFDLKNPNKVRALIGRFCAGNPLRFHAADGSGYRFLADRVLELDPLNPSIAARLVKTFSRWRRHDPARQALMKAQLERIVGTEGLSKDVYEIASRSLEG